MEGGSSRFKDVIDSNSGKTFYYDMRNLFYNEDYIDEIAPSEDQFIFNSLFKFLFWDKYEYLKLSRRYFFTSVHKTRMKSTKFYLDAPDKTYMFDCVITSKENSEGNECPAVCLRCIDLNLILNFDFNFTFKTIDTMDKVVVGLLSFVSLILKGEKNFMVRVA